MVDDTCYFIPCNSRKEAELLYMLLSSSQATAFFNSLIFVDSKRPITIEILRRLSIVQLARSLGKFEELQHFVKYDSAEEKIGSQLSLLMESGGEYKTKRKRGRPIKL
jgi:hypothetical protein